MPKFCLTVGQQYRRELHPDGLHPDGWVEIEAQSESEAQKFAFMTYGKQWSNIYPENRFNPQFYPRGCIRSVTTKQTNEK